MKFIIAWIKKYIFGIQSPTLLHGYRYEWDYLIDKYFDYVVIGEYYERREDGHLYKKYLKRYKRKKRR